MRRAPFLPILLCALPVLAHADYEAGVQAHERGDYRRALAELVGCMAPVSICFTPSTYSEMAPPSLTAATQCHASLSRRARQ